jgi:hypothetical protein
MTQLTVYSPVGINMVEAQPISARIGDLKGITIGLLNNSKTNSLMLQEQIVKLLEERYKIKGVVKNIKPNAALRAEGLEAFSKEVQAVITALGD